MSRLVQKVGLAEGAGLFEGAGLYKYGTFDPLSLNPYLLFDAQTSMIGTLENPTLDLDPATPSTLDVITATRAGTTATFTDSSGLIQVASPNTTRVDYTQGAELTPTKFQNFGNTDFTSSLWVKNNATVTFNQEPAPDGTQTAAKYVGSGTGQDLYYNSTFTGPFTYSLFVKYINAPYVRLRNDSTSTWFNLTTGSVATKNHDSASIEDVGDSWFRISVTVSSASSLLRAYIHPHATDNTTAEQDGGSFYLWGPQLEEGTTASPFVANTTLSPKFTGISATFAPRVPMILCEPSATNLLPYSEDFSNSAWTKTNTSVTGGFTSPDGTENAFLMTDDSTDSKHVVYELDICPQDSSIYTRSVFVKKGTARYIVLSCRHTPTSSGTSWIYDTDTNDWASIGSSGVGQSIEIYGNGWVRLSISHISNSNFNNDFSIGIANGATVSDASYSGSGNSVYIWGAQLETGSVATSIIPTSGSTVTRAADDLVISGSAFSSFFNASEGTTYMETAPKTTTNIPHIFEYHNSSDANANRMGAYLPNISLNAYVRSSGVTTVSLFPGSINLNQLNRVAISYKVNDILGSLNGSSEVADTSAALPSGLDKLHIGNVYNFNFPLNGHIKRLIYWPYHSDSL